MSFKSINYLVHSFSYRRNGVVEKELKERWEEFSSLTFLSQVVPQILKCPSHYIFAACSHGILIPLSSGIIRFAYIVSVYPLSWQTKGSTKCTEVVWFVT